MKNHHIILVGGGHTHVQVMRAFAEKPEPGTRLTLVSERDLTPYSGMLPGHIAGLYRHDEMHIDLARLAKACDVTFVPGQAVALERAEKTLILKDGQRLQYDTLSLNIGITPDLSSIAGAAQHGLAVKPISSFLERLETRLTRTDHSRRILIVGGGAAGVELALALKARLTNTSAWIGLVTGSGLLPALNNGLRRKAEQALARHGIHVIAGFRVGQVTQEGIKSTTGRFIAADTVILSTAARAPGWLQTLGLPLVADGSVLTHATLATLGDEAIFAAGDCGALEGDSRPKAGVFAVRQGPVLAENLRRRVRGQALEPYRPQQDFLTLLATGDGRAIAGRGPWLSLEGRWVWRWKDWIDRRFMARFNAFRRG
jgi:pyridine nucleotide-disulfide oxidoreductase family protein